MNTWRQHGLATRSGGSGAASSWAARLLILALVTGAAPPPLQGQAPDRAELLQSARSEFDDTRAMAMLVEAIDPSLAPPDSLWAVSIHELAFALIRSGNEDAARLWLRWAARHAPQWPLDREWFPPAVAAVWDRARLDVGPATTDPVPMNPSEWGWDGASATGLPGQVSLADGALPSDARVMVARPGETPLPTDPGDAVEPGSYVITITADGHEPVDVEREVLPGVDTRLRVDLTRSLSQAAQQEAARRTATIRWGDGTPCTNGVVVGDGRMVLTSLRGLGARSGLTVEAGGGSRSFTNVPVVRTDEVLDLAVLRLDRAVPDLPESLPGDPSRHGWVSLGSDCGGGAEQWTRLQAMGTAGNASWALEPAVAAAALGAPLMHPDGGLLGIVTNTDTAVPLQAAGPIIFGPFADQVAQVLAAPTVQRSGLPWKWIGAGIGLAGIGAAIAVSSGGGDGGGGPPAPGTIVITFPGG